MLVYRHIYTMSSTLAGAILPGGKKAQSGYWKGGGLHGTSCSIRSKFSSLDVHLKVFDTRHLAL